MRETILEYGGEIRFGTRRTGLVIEDGRAAGIRTEKARRQGAKPFAATR